MNAADLVLSTAAANNAWSAQQAEKQMQFQREMSNTAHQREIDDLRKAGLNPVLSAKLGGASTPTGAMGDTDMSTTSALLQAVGDLTSGVASGVASGFARSVAKNLSGSDDLLYDALNVLADALPYRWRKSAHGAIDLLYKHKSDASDSGRVGFVDRFIDRFNNWMQSSPYAGQGSLLSQISNKKVKSSTTKNSSGFSHLSGSVKKSSPLVTKTAGR